MEGLLILLLVGGLFWLMMRYGCGAHLTHHGHGHGHADRTDADNPIDPVCGVVVDPDLGYGKMHEGRLYRFCSRSCLERFDAGPTRYIATPAEGKS